MHRRVDGGGTVISLALATFAFVFLAGFQSRSVNSHRYASAFCTSWLIAAAQVNMTRGMISDLPAWRATVAMGVAGSLAVVSAMWLHFRVFSSHVEIEWWWPAYQGFQFARPYHAGLDDRYDWVLMLGILEIRGIRKVTAV